MDEEVKYQLYRKQKRKFTKELRRNMTREEIILWEELRNRKFRGMKFRRQVNIGPFIADFLCKQHRLIVEVDGDIHNDRRAYDRDRDTYLRSLGYYITRVTNDDIHIDLDDVLNRIYNSIYSRSSSIYHVFTSATDLTPNPSPPLS